MFVEFYALDDLVASCIDFIEDVSADNRVNSLSLSRSEVIHWAICFVNSFGLTILYRYRNTVMFQVLIVPSCDPLTRTLPITKRLETLFVCPVNWFKISPWLVKLHSTMMPSSKLPKTVFSVKQAETISSRICAFCYSSWIISIVPFFITFLPPKKWLPLTSPPFLWPSCPAAPWWWSLFSLDPSLRNYSFTSDWAIFWDGVEHVSCFFEGREEGDDWFLVTLESILEGSWLDYLHNIKLIIIYTNPLKNIQNKHLTTIWLPSTLQTSIKAL